MSDRRHELQQNDLAIWLGKINRSIEPYSRMIAVAVVVVVVGAIGLGFYNTQQSGDRSDATLQLIQATASPDAEVLLNVGENYPKTAAGAWSRLYRGQKYLSDGIQALYSDRINAEELLGDAQTSLRNALASSEDTLLRSRAHFGIARAAESLGNVEEAIAAYREVIAVNESDVMVKKAEERIETLSQESTERFLVWFADQDFSPADPSLPPSLPGGQMLPDLPDLSLPELSLSSEGGDEMELKDGIELPTEGEIAEGKTADLKGPETTVSDADAKENDSDVTDESDATEVEAVKSETDPEPDSADDDASDQ